MTAMLRSRSVRAVLCQPVPAGGVECFLCELSAGALGHQRLRLGLGDAEVAGVDRAFP